MFVICNYMVGKKKKKSFIWIFNSFFLFALAFVAVKAFHEACGESRAAIAAHADATLQAQGRIRRGFVPL